MHRKEHETHADNQRELELHELRHELGKLLHELRTIRDELKPHHPTHIKFKEITMLDTVGGNTQVFTGTLIPAGSVFPPDTVFAVTSNDPALTPTVDTTGLVVTGPLPFGWVESATTPLEYAYTATSASGSLSATITPSAPPAAFPTGITFAQTQ